MNSTPSTAAGFSIPLILALVSAVSADEPKAKREAPAKKSSRVRPDQPPPCSIRHSTRSNGPAPRSMPEVMDRMSRRMMTDPATGWQGIFDDFSAMEGPATRDIALSAEEERRIGRLARDEYLKRAEAKGFRQSGDERKIAYFRALVERFAPRMEHRTRYPRIDITLIDASIPDGQSFPGGFLAFTTALLDEPDEATVAGVVAHELAHLDRGHLFEYARRSKLAEATFSNAPNAANANDFDLFFRRGMALFGLMMNPYRPEHENEADCTSVTWLYQEGYDPRGLVGFFERMFARNRDQPANPVFNFGRSHPFSLNRRDHVLARLRQLQRWRRRDDLGLFAENLQRLEPRRVQRPRGE